MAPPFAHYREFAPSDTLRDSVRAFFSFGAPAPAAPRRPPLLEVRFRSGDPFCSPVFADGHISLVFSFSRVLRRDGLWRTTALRPQTEIIGPMTRVGPAASAERREMMGAYLRPGVSESLTAAPAGLLSDRVETLEALWGSAATRLLDQLAETEGEVARLDLLESALVARLSAPRPAAPWNLPDLAAHIRRRRGCVSVADMAADAGISRQHLARAFRLHIGVSPKTYCCLARFQAALQFAGRAPSLNWAQAAVDLGYSDQSHLIAEFRRFSSLTPQQIVHQRCFHPFIVRR